MVDIEGKVKEFVAQNNIQPYNVQSVCDALTQLHDVNTFLQFFIGPVQRIDEQLKFEFVQFDEITIRQLAMLHPFVVAISSDDFPLAVCLWSDDQVDWTNQQAKKDYVNGALRMGFIILDVASLILHNSTIGGD